MTKKKKAQLTAAELDAIRSEALELIGMGLCRFTMKGVVLFIDRQAMSILELDKVYKEPAEIEGKNLGELIQFMAPRDVIPRKVREQKSISNEEYHFRTLSGQDKWVQYNAHLIVDEATGEEAVQAVFIDITDRRKTEEHLQEVLEGARCILWHAIVVEHPDGAFTWEITVSNRDAAQRILPLGREARQSYSDVWHWRVLKEERDRMDEISSAALRSGKTGYSQEYRCRRMDGQIMWMFEDARISVLGPKRWLVVGVCTDITEYKQAEEARRVSEERYRAIVQDHTDLICRFSPDATLTFVNDAYSRYFGKREDELIGVSFLELAAERDRKTIQDALADLSIEWPSVTLEFRVVLRETGDLRWHQWTIRGIFDKEGLLIELQGVGRDVTERRQQQDYERAITDGLRAVVAAADELISCPDVDTVYRRTVEIGRSRLGLERCAIFIQDGPNMVGTYGTDRQGETTDEHTHSFPMVREWMERFQALRPEESRMIVSEQPFIEIKNGVVSSFGFGWIAITPILSGSTVIGVLCNDTALTGKPIDESQQEIVSVFCSLLGAVIERKRAGDTLQEAHDELERRVQARTIELMEANASLAEKGRILMAILDNVPDMAWLKDEQGRIVAANEPFGKACGFKVTELPGKNDRDLWPRDLADKYHADDLEVMQSGRRKSIEEPIAKKDGIVGLYETIKTPIFNAQGEVIGTTGIARDITQRKRAEKILQQSKGDLEELVRKRTADLESANRILQSEIQERKRAEVEFRRLAMVVEQAAESIIITDTEANIQYVNPAFETMSGYSREEVLEKNPRILKSGKQDEVFYRRMWETLSNGQVWSDHFTNRRKDGTLYEVDATILPIRDEAGKTISYVAACRDVTREMQLEAQFRQAQKMEAVGRLAGGIAHDFNNLLTSILGFSRLVYDKLDEGHPLREDIEEVLRAGDRAATLTRQLLAFSRKQMIQAQPLNLNTIVVDMDKLLRRTLGEDIELVTLIECDDATVKADAGLIEQVLMNLAVNARDAMPKGGKLVIRTTRITLDTGYCNDHVDARPGEYAVLSVHDTGVGMTEEVREHCFEPFYTSKEKGKGTGLGLTIVYSVVKQFGGFIDILSAPKAGTEIAVYFPITDLPREARAPREEVELPRGRETILVVEDEDTVRRLTVRILESLGYKVLQAAHGGEALLICERFTDPIHLILSDVVMPQIGGPELIERLQKLRSDFKVLYMSGFTDMPFVERNAGERGTLLMVKPFTKNTIALKVRSVLDSPRK